jgi:hypothetical protein
MIMVTRHPLFVFLMGRLHRLQVPQQLHRLRLRHRPAPAAATAATAAATAATRSSRQPGGSPSGGWPLLGPTTTTTPTRGPGPVVFNAPKIIIQQVIKLIVYVSVPAGGSVARP